MSQSPTTVLWGGLGRPPFVFRRGAALAKSDYQPIRETVDNGQWLDTSVEWDDANENSKGRLQRPVLGSWRDFFFGFMYEDDYEDNDTDCEYLSDMEESTHNGSSLLWILGLSLALSSASTSCASTLVSAMAHDVSLQHLQLSPNLLATAATVDTESALFNQTPTLELVAQHFAQNVASAAIWGTALGKLGHGMVPDLLGARRTFILYAWGLCLALLVLALVPTSAAATRAAFGVEFVSAVQWPCAIVLLATHFRGGPTQQHLYQRGVAVTSLASRCGSLVAIPMSARCLQWGVHWRWMAVGAAWCAALSASLTYLYVTDSVRACNEPQNPIDPLLWSQAAADAKTTQHSDESRQGLRSTAHFPTTSRARTAGRHWSLRLYHWMHWIKLVLWTNVWPSMSHILGSTTFWMVALAHTGSTMVRTSQRLLGTYLYATRSSLTGDGVSSSLTYEQAASLAVWYSIGTVLGLAIAGPIFTQTRDLSARQWMIGRLYLLCILSCYVLACLAIPSVRFWLGAPPDAITSIQVFAAAAAGFSIAVPSYHIPSWVGVTFGCDKGLFSAYTDGVACAVSCLLWRHVHSTMWKGHEIGTGGGGVWAYAWAAIAFFLILSASLMVEFMGHFFRKRQAANAYETIVFT